MSEQIIPKQFLINVDVGSVSSLSASFMRCDTVKFIFNFLNYDDSNAVELRVFCRMKTQKAPDYAFAGSFLRDTSKTNDGWVALFTSAQTSGFQGGGILTAQLVDANGNLVNSPNINLTVLESYSNTQWEQTMANDAIQSLKMKIADGSNGYVVLEKDDEGNISPTYLTEAEYAQRNQ